MTISFDLDDTLIPPGDFDFETEPRTVFQRMIGVERIRKGTPELFNFLQEQGHTVGIYTTSFRPKLKLRVDLLTYGINPDFIITEKENRIELNRREIRCSKYPPAFNIDLHIDDSPGVEREGLNYNFKTVIINKEDIDWSNKVKNRC